MKLKVGKRDFWGCFACNNGHIAVRHKKCPTCRRPRSHERFGLDIPNYGYFFCSISTSNLILRLSFYRMDSAYHTLHQQHDLPFDADGTDENTWKDKAMTTIKENLNKPLRSISLSVHIPEGPILPASASLFEQVIYNASLHSQTTSQCQKTAKSSSTPTRTPLSSRTHRTPMHRRTPKGRGANPTAGFRYLQQMKNEQQALNKMVQAVIDRRSSDQGEYSLAELDADMPRKNEKWIECPLCERLYPRSQLPGRISLLAVQRWKQSKGVPITSHMLDESSYLQAFHTMQRLQDISVCVFCSQLLDIDVNEYIDKELIKQDTGVENILKGPLNRPHFIYKKQLRSLSKSLERERSQERESEGEGVEESKGKLRARSAQRIVTLAQARMVQNKYVDVEKVMWMLEQQKSKRQSGTGESSSGQSSTRGMLERRYVPLTSIGDILHRKKNRERKQASNARDKGAKFLNRSRSRSRSTDPHAAQEKTIFLTGGEKGEAEGREGGGPLASLSPVPEERGKKKREKEGGKIGREKSIMKARSLSPLKKNPAQSNNTKRPRREVKTLSPTRSRPSAPTAAPVSPSLSLKPTSSLQKKGREKGEGKGGRRGESKIRGAKMDRGEKGRVLGGSKKALLLSPKRERAPPLPASSPSLLASSSAPALKPRAPLLFSIQKRGEGGPPLVTSLLPPPPAPAPIPPPSLLPVPTPAPVPSPSPAPAPTPAPSLLGQGQGEGEAVRYPIITALRGKNKFKLIRKQQLEQQKPPLPSSPPAPTAPSLPVPASSPPLPASLPVPSPSSLSPTSPAPPAPAPLSLLSTPFIKEEQGEGEEYGGDFEEIGWEQREEGQGEKEGEGGRRLLSLSSSLSSSTRLPIRRSLPEEKIRLLSRGEEGGGWEGGGDLALPSSAPQGMDLLSPASRPFTRGAGSPPRSRARSRGGVSARVRKMQIL